MAGEPLIREMLEVAIDAAWVAGRRTLAYFNSGVAVESKADASPVTIADREAERIIRDRITRHYPDHTILGEEQGTTQGHPDYRWIIDPLDGTKSFIHGVPLYGVLIGIEIRQKVAAGVVYLPALDELIWAAEGRGCWWNGRPARVSTVDRLADACVSVTNAFHASQRSDAWERLASQAKIQRGWGDCYGHILVATGRIEAMLDPAMNPWDCAPLLPILTEAGGHFTTWTGEPTIWGSDALSTNSALHGAVLDITRSETRRST